MNHGRIDTTIETMVTIKITDHDTCLQRECMALVYYFVERGSLSLLIGGWSFDFIFLELGELGWQSEG